MLLILPLQINKYFVFIHNLNLIINCQFLIFFFNFDQFFLSSFFKFYFIFLIFWYEWLFLLNELDAILEFAQFPNTVDVFVASVAPFAEAKGMLGIDVDFALINPFLLSNNHFHLISITQNRVI